MKQKLTTNDYDLILDYCMYPANSEERKSALKDIKSLNHIDTVMLVVRANDRMITMELITALS